MDSLYSKRYAAPRGHQYHRCVRLEDLDLSEQGYAFLSGGGP